MPIDDEKLGLTIESAATILRAETVAPVGNQDDRLCTSCAAAKALKSTARLMDRSEADRYLALLTTQVEWLINTGQVVPIRIRGEERFDRRDLDLLIETYKQTAMRRNGSC